MLVGDRQWLGRNRLFCHSNSPNYYNYVPYGGAARLKWLTEYIGFVYNRQWLGYNRLCSSYNYLNYCNYLLCFHYSPPSFPNKFVRLFRLFLYHHHIYHCAKNTHSVYLNIAHTPPNPPPPQKQVQLALIAPWHRGICLVRLVAWFALSGFGLVLRSAYLAYFLGVVFRLPFLFFV